MRCVCSGKVSYKNHISDLKNWFYSKGYGKELVNSQVGRAASLYRDDISGKDNARGREIFSTVPHPALKGN